MPPRWPDPCRPFRKDIHDAHTVRVHGTRPRQPRITTPRRQTHEKRLKSTATPSASSSFFILSLLLALPLRINDVAEAPQTLGIGLDGFDQVEEVNTATPRATGVNGVIQSCAPQSFDPDAAYHALLSSGGISLTTVSRENRHRHGRSHHVGAERGLAVMVGRREQGLVQDVGDLRRIPAPPEGAEKLRTYAGVPSGGPRERRIPGDRSSAPIRPTIPRPYRATPRVDGSQRVVRLVPRPSCRSDPGNKLRGPVGRDALLPPSRRPAQRRESLPPGIEIPMTRRHSGSVSGALTRFRKCEYRSTSRDGRSMRQSSQESPYKAFSVAAAYHAFRCPAGNSLTTVFKISHRHGGSHDVGVQNDVAVEIGLDGIRTGGFFIQSGAKQCRS